MNEILVVVDDDGIAIAHR